MGKSVICCHYSKVKENEREISKTKEKNWQQSNGDSTITIKKTDLH